MSLALGIRTKLEIDVRLTVQTVMFQECEFQQNSLGLSPAPSSQLEVIPPWASYLTP